MQTSADGLADLEFPKLQQLLAEYIGAVRLCEIGSVNDGYVRRRLEKLEVSCRAADRLIVMLGRPQLRRQRVLLAPKDN